MYIRIFLSVHPFQRPLSLAIWNPALSAFLGAICHASKLHGSLVGPPSGHARRGRARQATPARIWESCIEAQAGRAWLWRNFRNPYGFRLFRLAILPHGSIPVRFLPTRIHWPNRCDFHRLIALLVARSPNRLLQLCWNQ